MEEKYDFLESHKSTCENGFIDEYSKSVIISLLMPTFRSEIVKEWLISDIIINGDRAFVKWTRRLKPLTDKEYNEKYQNT